MNSSTNLQENILKLMKENLGNRRQLKIQNKMRQFKKDKDTKDKWRIEACQPSINLIHDHQFWDEKKLDELDHKRANQADLWSEQDIQSRNTLLNNPFKHVSKKDFNSFINSSIKQGRNNIEEIQKEMLTVNDNFNVKNYHIAFWKN